jgi:hypothetical protein
MISRLGKCEYIGQLMRVNCSGNITGNWTPSCCKFIFCTPPVLYYAGLFMIGFDGN